MDKLGFNSNSSLGERAQADMIFTGIDMTTVMSKAQITSQRLIPVTSSPVNYGLAIQELPQT